jgi:hypothetical protein
MSVDLQWVVFRICNDWNAMLYFIYIIYGKTHNRNDTPRFEGEA